MATNQKAGSSNLSGRTTSSNMFHVYILAGCGKSRKSCNEAAQNASNVHARN
jgi:hypothetical protein